MLETYEIKRLIIERRKECGMGLCGSHMAIVRWLMREHGILTTAPWVESVLKEQGPKRDENN